MGSTNLIIKPKKPKGEDGYKVFSVRVREDVVAQIENMSFETGRSRNEIISLLLEFAIGHCTIEK